MDLVASEACCCARRAQGVHAFLLTPNYRILTLLDSGVFYARTRAARSHCLMCLCGTTPRARGEILYGFSETKQTLIARAAAATTQRRARVPDPLEQLTTDSPARSCFTIRTRATDCSLELLGLQPAHFGLAECVDAICRPNRMMAARMQTKPCRSRHGSQVERNSRALPSALRERVGHIHHNGQGRKQLSLA